MTAHEKRHIQNAFSFELGKVQLVPIRPRMVDMLLEVDEDLAKKVADHLGLVPKKLPQPITGSIPADGNPDDHHSVKVKLPITEALLKRINTVNLLALMKMELTLLEKQFPS